MRKAVREKEETEKKTGKVICERKDKTGEKEVSWTEKNEYAKA